MRQSGNFQRKEPLAFAELREMLQMAVHGLDVAKVRQDVLPFVRNPALLDVWSREFFLDIVDRIRPTAARV